MKCLRQLFKFPFFSQGAMDMSEEEFAGIDAFVQQKSLIEPVIAAQNLYSIYQCPDQQMYRARIQFLFNLDQYVFDQQTLEALIDMIHGAILFASDNDFSYPKAIVFLSIYLEIFKIATSSPYYLPNELFKRYEKILLSHSIDRPPSFTLIFELADIKLINEFFINTFFRHIKLIISCFTQKPILSFKGIFPVQVPTPTLPPLSEMEIEQPTVESINIESAVEQSAKAPAQKSGKSPRSPRQAKNEAQERSLSKAGKENTMSQKDSAKTPTSATSEPKETTEGEQPEDKGPEVPLEMLRGSLAQMHQKFIQDFDEKERQLFGKIKELEIRLQERPQVKKPAPKKK